MTGWIIVSIDRFSLIPIMFLSIFCALLIDHFRPMRTNNLFLFLLRVTSAHIKSWCSAGSVQHERIGWALVSVGLVIPVLLIYLICLWISPFAAFLWNIFILYLCMGFRNYNHYFLAIQMALLNGEQEQARKLLAEWCDCETSSMDTSDITRMAIEKALISVQKDVFGIIFWFALPFGPAGAVFYRVSSFLQKSWTEPNENEVFGRFAKRIFYWIDWIPVRLTAISFAVVGNFEDAIYAWRHFASRWKNRNIGILLASAGGAIGVRLGAPFEQAVKIAPVDLSEPDMTGYDSEVLPGEEPKIRFLQSALGLIWRALLLWLLILLLFTIAF